jgi:hypothetical protein
MKIGVNISIDVTKLDKARFVAGKNGQKYADLVAFIDIDQQNEYGKNGSVTQNCTKEERDAKLLMPYIGNVKVFYKDEGQQQPKQKPAPEKQSPAYDDFDNETIPF